MREIKLNTIRNKANSRERYSHDGYKTRFFVDESDVKFENGTALVKAKVLSEYGEGKSAFKQKRFSDEFFKDNEKECYGVINENFEEAYSGRYEGEQYLMFFESNKETIKVDNENYLVVCDPKYNDDFSTRQIRNKENKWEVHDIFFSARPTKKNNLFVVVRRNSKVYFLYDALKSEPLTRRYAMLRELESDGNTLEFMVCDNVYSKVGLPGAAVSDTLTFKIDEEDSIISPIYSSLLNEYYIDEAPQVQYDVIKENRQNELEVMAQKNLKLLSKSNKKLEKIKKERAKKQDRLLNEIKGYKKVSN